MHSNMIASFLASVSLLILSGVHANCGVQFSDERQLALPLEFIDFTTAPLIFSLTPSPIGYTAWQSLDDITIDGSSIISVTGGVLQSNEILPVPSAPGAGLMVKGTLTYEATLLSGSVTSPLGWEGDPFYATSILGMTNNNWTIAFLITNTRVYAMYMYTEGGDYYRYVIPVATRFPQDYATYSVYLTSDFAVSYRINDKEVLRVGSPFEPIAPKFNTGTSLDWVPSTPPTLPTGMRLIFGNYKLEPANTSTQTVCQGTIFSQCKEDLRWAQGTQCKYTPIGDYFGRDPIFEMVTTYIGISAASYTTYGPCVYAGCEAPAVSCPRVKPIRRQYQKPQRRQEIMPVRSSPPSQPNAGGGGCGCGRSPF